MTIQKKFVLNRWPTKVIFEGFSSSGASTIISDIVFLIPIYMVKKRDVM